MARVLDGSGAGFWVLQANAYSTAVLSNKRDASGLEGAFDHFQGRTARFVHASLKLPKSDDSYSGTIR